MRYALIILAALLVACQEPQSPVIVQPPVAESLLPPAFKGKVKRPITNPCIFREHGMSRDCVYNDKGLAKVSRTGVKPYFDTEIITDEDVGY